MKEEGQRRELDKRTTDFGVRVVRASKRLPRGRAADVLGRQMLRSGTSVGAQFREAKRARSDAEFISKVTSAHQELEETIYWFELLVRADIVEAEKMAPLQDEAGQLSAILATIVRNMKNRK
ncbi:MAG: four helix bundle protein [Planctomycetota bacterium]